MPRRTIVFAITLAVTISVVASWSSGTSAQEQVDRRSDDRVAGVGRVTWGPCVDRTLASFDAECGLLSVPLDYSKPAGAKIRLALSRVRHTVPDDEYQGIMLVNPGGPGGSGLIFAILGAFVPDGAGEAYDWIGFDPRGVGDSVPSLHCQPTYSAGPRPPYEPETRYIEAAWLDKVAAYAADCRRAGGRLLDHVKTIDNAQDMNAIRWALGESKLNYYGFSYGTYLGFEGLRALAGQGRDEDVGGGMEVVLRVPADQLEILGERHVAFDNAGAHPDTGFKILSRLLWELQRSAAAVTDREIGGAQRFLRAARELPLEPAVVQIVDQEERTRANLDLDVMAVVPVPAAIRIFTVLRSGSCNQACRRAQHSSYSQSNDTVAHGRSSSD